MRSAFSILLVIFTIGSCSRDIAKPQLFLGGGEEKWVRKVLRRMTLEEKVGQMIACRYTGRFINRDSDYFKNLEEMIVKWKIGGLIVFGGEVYETAHLTNAFQELAEIPLLIASDFERGAGNQIDGATLFPPLMALGAAGSEELAYTMGRLTALEGRAMGVHMTYAPVVDVNSNPANPIINTRSIGEDPELVSRIAAAFIQGCQENGLIATAKHFPGHGDTDLDSHTLLPMVSGDRERLNRVELYPFRKAIDAGVQAIMTAHLHVPALDSTPGLPATLSPLIMTGLLRKEMGFKGLIVTDSMGMGGITSNYASEEAALGAVQAGVDMVLLPPDPPEAIRALVQAVSSGLIPESRIDASVKRILEAKARLGLHKKKLVEIIGIDRRLASKELLEQAARTFESAITLVRNEGGVLPIEPSEKKIAVFSLSSDIADYYAGRDFGREIEKRAPGTAIYYADAFTGMEYLQEGIAKAAEADIVIFALFSTVRADKGTVDLNEKHIQVIKEFEAGAAPTIVISFGSPYFLKHFPEVDAYICAFRSPAQAQEAAAKALFGEIDIRGKLPVSLPGLYPAGHGLILDKKPEALHH
jgi:beta-N-acetylhexosaminidase